MWQAGGNSDFKGDKVKYLCNLISSVHLKLTGGLNYYLSQVKRTGHIDRCIISMTGFDIPSFKMRGANSTTRAFAGVPYELRWINL